MDVGMCLPVSECMNTLMCVIVRNHPEKEEIPFSNSPWLKEYGYMKHGLDVLNNLAKKWTSWHRFLLLLLTQLHKISVAQKS